MTAIAGAKNECGRQSTVSERKGGERATVMLTSEVQGCVGTNRFVNKREWKEQVKAVNVAFRIYTAVTLQATISINRKACSNTVRTFPMLSKISKLWVLTNFLRVVHQLRTGCFIMHHLPPAQHK